MSLTSGLGSDSQSNLMKLATLNSSFQQQGQQSIDQDMGTFEKKLAQEAEAFEESLLQETTLPLKRALARYEFYSRQDEQRQERKRELGSLVKRKERGFQQYTTTQQRLEKKCSTTANHHDYDAYLCLGQGGQLVEKNYYGPLLVYSNNSSTSTAAAVVGDDEGEEDLKKHSDHHEKLEQVGDESHSYDDLIHEAILEEQKHLIETFSAMENGKLPTPSGVASKPVYLGEDGTLYNLYYEPLPKQDPNMLRGRGKFSQLAYGSSVKSSEAEIVEGIKKAKQLKDKKNLTSEEELIVKKYGQVVNNGDDLVDKYVRRGRMLDRYEYQHDPDLYLSAPDPESFTSFDDYEEALLNWTKQVESKLGYLQLPRVMGRHYFRPAERSENSAPEPATDVRASTHLHGSRHISENLTSIALRGLDDDSLDAPNTMGHETWESQLVPLEPKPEFYETFKEYEMAMIRWAIVTLGLPFLPPHVAQYQTLLGLKLVNEPTFQISGVQVSSQDSEEKGDLEASINDDDEDRLDDDKLSVRYEVKSEWENLKPKVKQEIASSIQKVLDTKLENKKKFGSYHRPVLPTVHGTLKSESKAVPLKLITQGERTKPENVRSWIIYQRQKKSLSCVPANFTIAYESANASDFDHQMPLRRKDLTADDIRASQDCEQVERDEVNFESPEFDLGEINFELLSETPNYMMFLQIVLARKDNEKRFNHLNSWYFPKEEQYNLNEVFGDLCSVLDRVEHPSQMKVSHFVGIFQSSVYLDYFQKFLNTDLKLRMSMMKNGVEIPVETYGKLMFCSTTKQHFSAILSFFHNCNSPLTHVKVAHYVKEFLKQENAKDVISEYLQDDDYTTLHYIARAVTLFDEVPVQLYEYTESTRNVVINIVLSDGKKKDDSTLRIVDKFLVNLLMLYYTNCITVSLVEEDKAYPHVYPFLVSKLEKYIDEVNKYLKCSKSFLKSHIWKILGSRTKSVTALGKFVLSFLFFLSWKDDIKNALKSEDTELLNNIRKLASSTFSHVQNATARLFPLLKEYEDLLTKDYRDGNRVLRDLDLAETKSARQAVVDSRPPLVASMVLEFLNESLTVRKDEFGSQQDAYYHMIVGLIESRVFTLVLDEVLATVTQKRVHQGTVMGSLFIAKFAKFLVCNQLVPQDKTNDTNTTKWGVLKGAFSLKRKEVVEVKQALYSGSKVEINSAILLSMWDFIGKPDRLRKTYRPRCAMLIAFRHLIKVPEIFNMMPKDSLMNFYTKLLELCKDDVDMEFNRNAWRLFYQLIKFHGEDVMKDIVAHNMSGFLNLITVQKSIIATNALHYFNKIFNLPTERNISNKLNSFATPELVCEKGFNVPQKTNVQYIKTVDLLINFIINRNMVEAIFSNAYNLWSKDFKGWPFQSLATLFYTLNTHSACTKLQQAFIKAGIGNTLNVVCRMVSAPEDSSYNDYKRRFKLDKDVMDWNMKHKHYLYIKSDEKK